METMNGFTGPIKPLITLYSALETAILTVADNIYLTILQKGENHENDLPLIL